MFFDEDFPDIWDDELVIEIKPINDSTFGRVGDSIVYYKPEKKFEKRGVRLNEPPDNFINMGTAIGTNEPRQLVRVLYHKWFIIPAVPTSLYGITENGPLQAYYAQTYIKCKESMLKNMPRCKKLRRLNLQMPNLNDADIICQNIDILMKVLFPFGEAESCETLRNSSFLVKDKNLIKYCQTSTGNIIMPTIESMQATNLLFLFNYKTHLYYDKQ